MRLILSVLGTVSCLISLEIHVCYITLHDESNDRR